MAPSVIDYINDGTLFQHLEGSNLFQALENTTLKQEEYQKLISLCINHDNTGDSIKYIFKPQVVCKEIEYLVSLLEFMRDNLDFKLCQLIIDTMSYLVYEKNQKEKELEKFKDDLKLYFDSKKSDLEFSEIYHEFGYYSISEPMIKAAVETKLSEEKDETGKTILLKAVYDGDMIL
ncbi:hypothetical protein TVAG_018230 [Trichomonas vaginalis G3]|uniref:Uncharacterized protein n=1 Tax=Trichomonas vaginalis (strain ATCC PRA-98 / G3) TaxID=412133 RepID=A2F9V9_TRIV3|nr:histone-lysine N-methyltransferase family [Trichomonas vaginalis G3]EAX98287.1 hypothetical protein TVAG_018230 [Trichomonas vaginalis G3]KAI5517483.1 histone-lysine N-methyltransferase family [Trichomonas vaginalis G3]|eukprot:XP_001311217.1 hypothetical protein [Trichomonas vaginalis G3]